MSVKEVRSLAVECRVESRENGQRTLVSMVPPWDTLSRDLGGFRERFMPGAFGNLDGVDVVATFQHEGCLLLGRTPRTLRLRSTDRGLEYEVDLPDTSAGRDVAVLVERGDIRGSSFEFSVPEQGEEWNRSDDGGWIRTVRAAVLWAVNPVVNPAYNVGTDVALRSLEEAKRQRQQVTFFENEEEDLLEMESTIALKRLATRLESML